MRPLALICFVLVAASLAAQGRGGAPRAVALRATFIGNEAWHITDGEYTLLTDFPYQSGYSGYMRWEWSKVPGVPSPSKLLIVTTHQHRDHFAAELLPRFNPGGVIGPASVRDAAGSAGIAPGPEGRFGPITVQAIPTPHANLEHYSYVLQWHGVRLYLPGDTEDTASLTAARDLDVAFVTSWMLRAVERLGATIAAHRIIVVHHEAGADIPPYQGSTVPRQGEVLQLEHSTITAPAPR